MQTLLWHPHNSNASLEAAPTQLWQMQADKTKELSGFRDPQMLLVVNNRYCRSWHSLAHVATRLPRQEEAKAMPFSGDKHSGCSQDGFHTGLSVTQSRVNFCHSGGCVCWGVLTQGHHTSECLPVHRHCHDDTSWVFLSICQPRTTSRASASQSPHSSQPRAARKKRELVGGWGGKRGPVTQDKSAK